MPYSAIRSLPIVLAVLVVSNLIFGIGVSQAQLPSEGLTIITLNGSADAFLLDLDLNVVRTYHGDGASGRSVYLLPDDSVLRPAFDPNGQFLFGGAGGRLQRVDVNDNVVWDYFFSTFDHQQHHDIEPLANGNMLVIAWERKTRAEAEALGRVTLAGEEMWPTLIVELEPVGTDGANVVWEWHLWDHIIQDTDPNLPNFGVVADHPELIDINLGTAANGSWDHANSIDYNPERDEIVLSCHRLNEVVVIDHSTTSAEAASHTGGNRGRGGDILYRWGNPANYQRPGARKLFGAHGANWVDQGRPGQGNIMVYNNGNRAGSTSDFSSAEELVPPVDANGDYVIDPGQSYGPAAPVWSYSDPATLYSPRFGSAERLPNGNTLISEGIGGYVFEVTLASQVVWEYQAATDVFATRRYSQDPPVPAFVQASQANWEFDHVELTWSTVREAPDLSARVFRAEEGLELRELQDVRVAREGSRYQLQDGTVERGRSYTYRVDLSERGISLGSFESRVRIPAIAFHLSKPAPNPFNPRATLMFEVAVAGPVQLQVFDLRGRVVRTLVDSFHEAGTFTAQWDGTDTGGLSVASGAYLFRLSAAGREQVTKGVLVQ